MYKYNEYNILYRYNKRLTLTIDYSRSVPFIFTYYYSNIVGLSRVTGFSGDPLQLANLMITIWRHLQFGFGLKFKNN